MAIKQIEINPGLEWWNKYPRNAGCAAKKVDDI